jgi:ribosomal protein S18 acetylase RimI-like enzyme
MPPDSSVPLGRGGATQARKLLLLVKRYGFVRGILIAIVRRTQHLAARVYARETYLIFSFPAAVPDTPDRPLPNVTMDFATIADVEELARLSPAHYDRNKALYDQRLRSGYYCCLARYQDHVVGYLWWTGKEDDDPLTGLHIRVQPGTGYALDLHLAPDFRRRGIVPLLLKYGLIEGAKMGFNCVVMTVNSRNRNMLRLAKHLLSAQQTGRIDVTLVFGRPHSVWRVGDTSGRDAITL